MISESTRYRAPTVIITRHGGMDIEELGKDQIAKLSVAAIANQRGRHGSTTYREIQCSRIRCVERRAGNG